MPHSIENNSSYSRSIEIVAPAEAIFDALTNDLEGWWGAMDKPINAVGDIFSVSWGEPWYQFEVSKYEAPGLLSWTCIDANQIIHGLEGVQKEWVGTQLHWRIEEVTKNKCRVQFTHEGLVPEFICYDFCAASWDQFFGERLKEYLEA